MNWDLLAQIATSLGALLAAASLGAGFLLYRLNQRDEMATQFRKTVTTTRPHVEQLNDMVSFELARELASTAVHSRDLELPLEDLYAFCRPASGERPSQQEVTDYLEKNFPVITVPLNTQLVRDYQALSTSIAADIALYQTTFPGIFRVVSSIALLLENVLSNEKAIARDEKLWKAVIPELMEDDGRIVSLEHMKWTIAEVLTAIVMTHMKESRKQIELLTQMLDLVFEAYLNKTAAELNELGKLERGEKIRAMAETKRIPEDLHEAEKCLRHAFTRPEQHARYHTLLVDFEKSGERKEEEQVAPSPEAEGAPPAEVAAGGPQGGQAEPATEGTGEVPAGSGPPAS
jgi:hypothetical protein